MIFVINTEKFRRLHLFNYLEVYIFPNSDLILINFVEYN